MKNYHRLTPLFLFALLFNFSCAGQQESHFETENLYPWCVVAYDAVERIPAERIKMLKEMGFVKYAYDWRDKHLNEAAGEIKLAQENGLEVIAVWLWLNAQRDSPGSLSPANERIFEILKEVELKSTLWLSFSPNFFEGLSQEQSMDRAIEMIKFVHTKAEESDCKVALYNHRGWFGNPHNQVEIIQALPELNLTMVYNFHHAHEYLDEFPQIAKKMKPYLSAVNLNGMQKEGPKILPIGAGNDENEMIKHLIDEGFSGPWGILGHVENEDVKMVLDKNIEGLNSLKLN